MFAQAASGLALCTRGAFAIGIYIARTSWSTMWRSGEMEPRTVVELSKLFCAIWGKLYGIRMQGRMVPGVAPGR